MALYANQGSSQALTKSVLHCSALPFVSSVNLTGWHMNIPLDLRLGCVPTSSVLFVLLLQFLSPAHAANYTPTLNNSPEMISVLQVRRENVPLQSESLSLWSLSQLFCWFLWHQSKHQILRSSHCSWTDDIGLFLLSIYSYSSKFRAVF